MTAATPVMARSISDRLVRTKVDRRRARIDVVMRSLAFVAAIACVVPLAAVIFYVVINGLAGLSLDLLTKPPRALGIGGGAASAILGSLQMVALATIVAVPVGTLAAVYVNEFVNEDGVWKYKTDHAYNTWVINYNGGWAKQTRGTLPGPNKAVPPDRPPSLVFEAFPKTFDLPWNYKNPVTGK